MSELITFLLKLKKVFEEDTNALDDPCCGWGPLYNNLIELLDRYYEV